MQIACCYKRWPGLESLTKVVVMPSVMTNLVPMVRCVGTLQSSMRSSLQRRLVVIISDLSHPIVWLVRYVCSDKAEFSFLQKKTAF